MALENHMGKKAATPAAKPAEGEPVEGGDAPNVTPEEQDIYDRIGLGVRALAYDDTTHKDVIGMLQRQAGEPAKALASTAMMLFNEVDQKSGGKIPEELVMRSAEGALDEVIDMAEQTGTMQVDELLAKKALQELVKMVGEKYDVDPAEIQEEINSFDQAELQRMVSEQQQIAEA